MPINPTSISLGHCYATAGGELRKVIQVQGGDVTYVVRGKLAFPIWDREKWQTLRREPFANEVTRELPCDWHK